MTVLARERRFLLDHLARQAASDVSALWRAAEQFADQGFTQFIVDGFPQVVDGWIAAASDLAAEWFQGSAPGATVVVADPIPTDRLDASARWSVNGGPPAGGLGRLQKTTQRSVYDGARETTLINVRRADMRWARAASDGACAFCRMLATRTERLYTSRDTAATKVHDDCRCLPLEVPNPGTFQLSNKAQRWEDEYRKAIAEAGITADIKQVLSAWRKQSGIH